MLMLSFFQSIENFDKNLFLFLNGMHCTFFDHFMLMVTGKFIWIAMYAGILYVLIKNFHWKVALACTLCIAFTIVIADQVTASLVRPLVERPRPSNPASPIANLVHIVNDRRGGGFGFPSCHAANTFGLASFLLLTLRMRILNFFIICWALLNCYSRIYLGLHYPGDLLVGTAIGFLAALLTYSLLRYLYKDEIRKPIQNSGVITYIGGSIIFGIVIYSAIMTFLFIH